MKVLTTTLLSAFTLLMISCETCTTCSYTNVNDEEITEEFCGNSDDSDNFRKEMEDSAYVNRSKYDCYENH